MNPDWQAYLQSQHALIENGRVAHFSDAAAELSTTQSATVVTDLSHFDLIQFAGEDAQSFLQGQLTCDVSKVGSPAAAVATYGGYCNPKGRMLASFLLWRDNSGGYLMQLPSALRAGIQKRLAMYVLRAKVTLAADPGDSLVRIGVAGSHAGALVQSILGEISPLPLGVSQGERGSVISLSEERFELIIAHEHAAAVWQGLRKGARPVGAACWDWLDIKAGIPVILPETQEQFVPQMVNLDVIGGVSFEKGCYPGQEIVARTQYLGKIKRRMYLAGIKVQPGRAAMPIRAGDELFSADMGDQSSGTVVNAAPSPGGGYDVLAVIQISSAEASQIRWTSPDGPALEIMPLPYAVDP
ncbi:folate-binding protein [Nitrosospira sp. Is2]|uniref:CAF17-like 4Fe-4S cluster assembly/insertion protein YgfZ n=1 Tax=Nitrosospira sp. Is2 TaxID=3080532 RepID=UPI00295537CE|nr:folate-binding protein [Nitrosospira sp. Is2]WON74280.1 folate-binding protein [Nitrosospira sp. Is2]